MLTTGLDTTISDNDYTLSTTMITFESNQSTASFEVSIKNDFVFQPDRILSLSINPLDDNSMPGRDSVAVITVTNDDAEISLTTLSAENPLSVSVTEGSDLSATLQLNINPVVDPDIAGEPELHGRCRCLSRRT